MTTRKASWMKVGGVSVLMAAMSLMSCGRPPLGQSDSRSVTSSNLLVGGPVTLSIPLPPGAPMSSVVLGANSTLLIGNNVSVLEEGSSGSHPMIANTGTGTTSTTQTGVSLKTDLWSIGNVFLATGTSVAGSVTTAGSLTQQTGVTVAGSVLQHQTLSAVPTTLAIIFPSSSTNITLQPGHSSGINPGGFAAVTVNANATLTLQSGTYYFDSLDVEPQGKIALTGSGPFILNVKSSFVAKGQLVLPASSPPATLIVADAGTADVFLQAQFDGTLVAPNANVTLAAIGTASYHGAFFGKALTLQAGVTLVHRGTGVGTVTPIAECIITQSPTSFQAVFGYSSSALVGTVTVPFGPNNRFEPTPATRNQPQVFSPGRHTAQFAVPFDGHTLSWVLDGVSSNATAALPECTPACVQQLTDPTKPRIDTVLSTAPAPLSVDESIFQRDAFRWDDALPVPESYPDGTSRLYYGLVYLNSQPSLDVMDALRINYDSIPLFDTETQAFQAQGLTTLSYPFDGQGKFAFALIPGATYNAVRQAALDPNQPVEIFQAVQLRSMPATDAGLSVQTACGLAPVAQCVARASNGSLRAVFGYNNPADHPVTVPSGSDNALTGAPLGTVPPEAFNTGSHTAIFAVPFTSGAGVRWQLQGQTVSVNAQSPTCSTTVVSQIGVDAYNPFPAPATPTCRSATPAEAQYPGSRLPPAARVNTCVSLSYQYAGTLGFQWRGVTSDADDLKAQAAIAQLGLQDAPTGSASTTSTTTGSTQVIRSALFGKLFHKIVQAVVHTGASAVDGIRRGLNSVAGLFTGSTNVAITASALNTDPFLNPGGTPTPVLQAWGARFGKPISLQGVQVRSKKSIFLSVANLDGNNTGSVKVLNHLGSQICFNLTNNAAQIVDFTTLPLTVCPGGSDARIGGSPPTSQTVTVKDAAMNAMAQMTDVHAYMSKVAGLQVSQGEALTGRIANAIGFFNGDRAFTPCWSFSWANDLATFMTALGAVAADLGDQYVVKQAENGAKYVANGLAKLGPLVVQNAGQLTSTATALAGTTFAPLANAARDAANTVVAQVQAAAHVTTLMTQDGNDLTGALGTAARLQTAAASRAAAAASSAQGTLNQFVSDTPTVQSALQAAQTAAQNAEAATQALANALVAAGSSFAPSVTAIGNATKQAASTFVNLAGIVGQLALDTQRVGVDTIGALIGNYIGNLPIFQILEGIVTADLIYTQHKTDQNLSDRGVATHEYGHFTLCNLLDNVDPAAFAVAYDEAAAAGFITTQSPSATGSVMNESFADFIASQVVGGTNYARPTTSVVPTNNMQYCLESPMAACIEDNVASIYPNAANQSFNVEVQRATGTYMDALDGESFPPDADVPTNGIEWNRSGSGVVLAANPGSAGTDEVVALTGAALPAWTRHLLERGSFLREDTVFGGLSDAMVDQGVNYCARCQLFKLHTTDAGGTPICPASWVGPVPIIPSSGTPLICINPDGSCPDGTTPNPATQVCEPPCPGQRFDASLLMCVPVIIIG